MNKRNLIKLPKLKTLKNEIYWLKIIFDIYMKKNFKKAQNLLLFVLILFPPISTLLGYRTGSNFVDLTLLETNLDLFWNSFLFQFKTFGIFIPILLGFNLISKDFNDGPILTLIPSIPRDKYIIYSIVFVILHLFLLMIVSFFSFGVLVFFRFGNIILPAIFLSGFSLIFLYLLFYLSFTFILTTLTQKASISLISPILYSFLESLFLSFNMPLLSLTYHYDILFRFFETLILFNFNSPQVLPYFIHQSDLFIAILKNPYFPIVSFKLILSSVILVLVPIILFYLSFHGFNLVEIRLG